MERGAKKRGEPSAQVLMACLGDASRFRLVEVLIGGARCVTELAAEVGLSQSCTTRHLQALEKRHVVVGTREGKRVMYRLRSDEPGLDPLLAWALQPGSLAGPARPLVSRRLPGPRPASQGPIRALPNPARLAAAGPTDQRATPRPPLEPSPSAPPAPAPDAAEAPQRPARNRDMEDWLL